MLYGCLLIGNAAVGMTNFAVAAWMPTLLIRGHGIDASQAGYAFGTVGLVSSIIGVATWPSVVKLWTNRGRKDALVPVFAMALTASWICFVRSEEHTSELQSLMRISYAVFCLKKKNK